jgi:hypothetical protein
MPMPRSQERCTRALEKKAAARLVLLKKRQQKKKDKKNRQQLACRPRSAGVADTAPHFTCFTYTKVHILTVGSGSSGVAGTGARVSAPRRRV